MAVHRKGNPRGEPRSFLPWLSRTGTDRTLSPDSPRPGPSISGFEPFAMNQYRFWELVQQGELQQAERVMISQYPTGVGINRIHSAAICSEIGERLRGVLTATSTLSSPRLTELLAIIECSDISSRNSAGIDRK